MKVRITFEADDELREAINAYFGKDGKADYATVKSWFRSRGEADNADAMDALLASKEEIKD